MKTKRVIVVVFIIAIVLVAVLVDRYYVLDDVNTMLLRKSDEAYLFVRVTRRAYHVSYLALPWEALREWVNVPERTSDERFFLTVIRITPSVSEPYPAATFLAAADVPHFFTPINNTFYANCAGVVCKWSDGRFQSATGEHDNVVDDVTRLSSDSNTDINGWFKRGIDQGEVELSKGTTLKVKQGEASDSGTIYDIGVIERVGQPREELWRVNVRPRSVSRREYERALSQLSFR